MKGVFLASGRRILHTRKLNIAETPLPACVVIPGIWPPRRGLGYPDRRHQPS